MIHREILDDIREGARYLRRRVTGSLFHVFAVRGENGNTFPADLVKHLQNLFFLPPLSAPAPVQSRRGDDAPSLPLFADQFSAEQELRGGFSQLLAHEAVVPQERQRGENEGREARFGSVHVAQEGLVHRDVVLVVDAYLLAQQGRNRPLHPNKVVFVPHRDKHLVSQIRVFLVQQEPGPGLHGMLEDVVRLVRGTGDEFGIGERFPGRSGGDIGRVHVEKGRQERGCRRGLVGHLRVHKENESEPDDAEEHEDGSEDGADNHTHPGTLLIVFVCLVGVAHHVHDEGHEEKRCEQHQQTKAHQQSEKQKIGSH
mmetsp:Transcript_39719/g.102258  ORF Transcript_39719/g.102258 Transcript_39719/m.102258 type:complete len:313 (+) Transcript_39719:703-1641(+)